MFSRWKVTYCVHLIFYTAKPRYDCALAWYQTEFSYCYSPFASSVWHCLHSNHILCGRRVGFSITNHGRRTYPPESNDILNKNKVRWVKYVEKTCRLVVISPPRLMSGIMALRETLFQPYCVWTSSICMNSSQMITCIEKYFLSLCHVLIKRMKVNWRHTERVTVAEIKRGLWQNDWDIIWETYWE